MRVTDIAEKIIFEPLTTAFVGEYGIGQLDMTFQYTCVTFLGKSTERVTNFMTIGSQSV